MWKNNNKINKRYLQLILNLIYALFINYVFYVISSGWELNPKNWSPYLTPMFIITVGIIWSFLNILPNLLNIDNND